MNSILRVCCSCGRRSEHEVASSAPNDCQCICGNNALLVECKKVQDIGISSGKWFKLGYAVVLCLLGFASYSSEQASWYGEQHRGRLMANGQPFDPDKLTAASWFFELGTKVVVEHSGKIVIVTITDRGPNRRLVKQSRTLDLSRAAFAKLADPDLGIITVSTKRQREAHAITAAASSEVVTRAGDR